MTELTERENKVKVALENIIVSAQRQFAQNYGQYKGYVVEETTLRDIVKLFDPPPAFVPVIPAWEELTDKQRVDLMINNADSDGSTDKIYEAVRTITSKPEGD
jgi:hypothetical protein